MVGIMALGTIMYSYVNWATTVQRGRKAADTKAAVRMIMTQIANALDNDQAFYNTARFHSRLNCYVAGGDCPEGDTGPINVYLAGASAPAMLVDMSRPNVGFDMNGDVCENFNADTGNDACPFRFNVSGQIQCFGNCLAEVEARQRVAVNPRLNINIQLVFKPQNPGNFAPLNEQQVYNMNFARGLNQSVTRGYCNAVGGAYFASARFCSIGKGECPNGYYFKGLDSSGTIICGQKVYADIACAPGAAFVGTRADGKIICGKY